MTRSYVSLWSAYWSARRDGRMMLLIGFHLGGFRGKANKAVSSQFLPLYAISDVQIEVVEKDKTRQHSGKSGHVDFKNNQVVLNELSGNEYAINLKTIDETEYLKWEEYFYYLFLELFF